ncbi:MAG: hypothetical protein JOZ69_01195 [Myxococcales bacterium]|nr:hypothetical protein [Myxococcales bacterium]
MATTRGKSSEVALAAQLIAGTNKHFQGTTSVVVQGSAITPSAIVERLQTLVGLRNDVDTAQATAKAKVAAEKANSPPLRAFVSAYVAYLRASFGGKPDVLADFGITQKARKPQTAEAKTAAAAKRKATRAARHTMGTKQKAKVKGSVTGITVTPLTAAPPTAAIVEPAASQTAPAPAAGTTAATSPTRAT